MQFGFNHLPVAERPSFTPMLVCPGALFSSPRPIRALPFVVRDCCPYAETKGGYR